MSNKTPLVEAIAKVRQILNNLEGFIHDPKYLYSRKNGEHFVAYKHRKYFSFLGDKYSIPFTKQIKYHISIASIFLYSEDNYKYDYLFISFDKKNNYIVTQILKDKADEIEPFILDLILFFSTNKTSTYLQRLDYQADWLAPKSYDSLKESTAQYFANPNRDFESLRTVLRHLLELLKELHKKQS